MQEPVKGNAGVTIEESLVADMPFACGIGMSYPLRRDLLLAFDHRRRDWSSFRISGGSDMRLRDEISYAAGVEIHKPRQREQSWIQRSSFRSGFRWRTLPMLVEGKPVREWAITGGIGVPLGGSNGMLDVAIEAGSRGSLSENGVRERMIRIGVSLSAYEKWLPIRRRRR